MMKTYLSIILSFVTEDFKLQKEMYDDEDLAYR